MFLVSRGDNWPSNLLSTENMQNLSLYLLKSSVNLVVPFENENGFSERYKSTHTDRDSSSVIRWSPCRLPCGGKTACIYITLHTTNNQTHCEKPWLIVIFTEPFCKNYTDTFNNFMHIHVTSISLHVLYVYKCF